MGLVDYAGSESESDEEMETQQKVSKLFFIQFENIFEFSKISEFTRSTKSTTRR